MIYQLKDKILAADLFKFWDETILWSCLQGVMGEIYVDHRKMPKSAAAVLGDFVFLAGQVNEELIQFPLQYKTNHYRIFVPKDQTWQEKIELYYQNNCKKITRFATKKDTVFQREKLEKIIDTLPEIYHLRKIDQENFQDCLREEWSKDLVSQYRGYEEYEKLGLGFTIYHGNEIVAGASSYASYYGGIEIEVDTKKEFRRKGLAQVCCAALIIESLNRNLYPSWDAHNKASLALAEKLGYVFHYSYDAYEVWK